MDGPPLLLLEFLVVAALVAYLWWDIWRSGPGDDGNDADDPGEPRPGDGSPT